MKITVNDQILSGNMGAGWKNEIDAAYGFAKYCAKAMAAFIKNELPAAEIAINIDVERASGFDRDLYINVTDPDGEGDGDDCEIFTRLGTELLKIRRDRWKAWYGGDGSAYFKTKL